MDEDFNECHFETIFIQWSFEEIIFYFELMRKKSVDCIVQVIKGIDDSFHRWQYPIVKEFFFAEEEEINMHK
jgi:hypothetical protein